VLKKQKKKEKKNKHQKTKKKKNKKEKQKKKKKKKKKKKTPLLFFSFVCVFFLCLVFFFLFIFCCLSSLVSFIFIRLFFFLLVSCLLFFFFSFFVFFFLWVGGGWGGGVRLRPSSAPPAKGALVKFDLHAFTQHGSPRSIDLRRERQTSPLCVRLTQPCKEIAPAIRIAKSRGRCRSRSRNSVVSPAKSHWAMLRLQLAAGGTRDRVLRLNSP